MGHGDISQSEHPRLPLMRQHSADAILGAQHPKEGHFQGHQQSLSFNLGQPMARENSANYQLSADSLRAVTKQQNMVVSAGLARL